MVIIMLLSCHLWAQEVLSPAGGSAVTKTVQISYTIGEPVIATTGNIQNTLTQGFHQSILTVTPVAGVNVFQFEVKVYPNPTSDYLTVEQLSNNGAIDLMAHLFNMNGKLIQSIPINENRGKINMKTYVSSTYILKLVKSNNDSKSFRIVKR